MKVINFLFRDDKHCEKAYIHEYFTKLQEGVY